MWDPQAYRDTDYGLGIEEPFEPSDTDGDDGTLHINPYVMTVLGAIHPDQLGICQPHEHVLRDRPPHGQSDGENVLDRLDLVASELEIFFTVGGRSMVDLTTSAQGRNLPGLLALAQRVPVHLICSIGLELFASARLSPQETTDAAIVEISKGVGPWRIKPGVLALDAQAIRDRGTWSTVFSVVRSTGIPVFLPGAAAMREPALDDFLDKLLVTGSPVVLGGADSDIERSRLSGLAARGVYLCVDDIGRRVKAQEADAAIIVSLAEQGLDHRLLISQGLGRPRDLISYGGQPGWGYLLERFTLTLMEAGASTGLVRKLLIENPASALTISPPHHSHTAEL